MDTVQLLGSALGLGLLAGIRLYATVLILVLIAFVIATPLAWWAMQQWLQDFVYRTTLSWWIFAIGGAGMILIALLVLSIRTIQSAMANPVKSLRTE